MNHEARLQIVVVNALRLALPDDAVVWATINERRTTPQDGNYLNRMGRVKGMPDLNVVYRGRYYGIELKLPKDPVRGLKKTYQSKEQVAAEYALERAGAPYGVCRTLNEVLDFLAECGVPLKAKLKSNKPAGEDGLALPESPGKVSM